MKYILVILISCFSLSTLAQNNFENENLIAEFTKHFQTKGTLDLQGDTLFISIIDENNLITRFQYVKGKIKEIQSPTMCDQKDIRNHCLQIWTKGTRQNGENIMGFQLTSWGVNNGYVKFKQSNKQFIITGSYYVYSID